MSAAAIEKVIGITEKLVSGSEGKLEGSAQIRRCIDEVLNLLEARCHDDNRMLHLVARVRGAMQQDHG